MKPYSARTQSVVAIMAVIAMLAVAPLSFAETGDGTSPGHSEGNPSGAGMQAASFAATIPYGAAKVLFALTGGIVGGLTYAFTGGDSNAAKRVWQTSMYGTYVITPEHLRGEKPVRFLGVPDEKGTPEPAASADATPAEPIR